ncbi:glycosyltransferase family 4 protein [Microlunatus flavus]|uniref:Phosphatidylinositol alpha-1,6-mannosyltransferase n=1 Tax=Microlunatus flavus TaxID=1036181 RepID=A0A1H9HKU1_9ACTN|nr:glycosyltransferase family 4 protein [Microlunatus flavus]SEQ62927.1 phosphatidylinositol alpha-1,6-mannosyltransferase [Microlunatus flavus]
MPTTLVVTNDFPPRIGGIESFVAEVCRLLDDDVVVLASGPPGASASDAGRPYRVVRHRGLLLPTPDVARRAADLLRASGASRVVVGAAMPLGLLAPGLRRAGAEVVVALTHGHEVWWATLPGARAALRRVGDACDHLTTISGYTARRIAPALSPAARARLLRLPPPVAATFRPPARPNDRPDRPPTVVAVGRFVAQKGFDVLLRAWPAVVDGLPPARRPRLVLVGAGPDERRLRGLADAPGVAGTVTFAGALPAAEVSERLRAADVFALPVRTRLAGLNPEGLGLAALEAAACGLPVLVGRSGGAPETVLDGLSGHVLDSRDVGAWSAALLALLGDPVRARAMGEHGTRLVEERFGQAQARRTLRDALRLGSDPVP